MLEPSLDISMKISYTLGDAFVFTSLQLANMVITHGEITRIWLCNVS